MGVWGRARKQLAGSRCATVVNLSKQHSRTITYGTQLVPNVSYHIQSIMW